MRYIEVKKTTYHFKDVHHRVDTGLGEMWVGVVPDKMEFEWSYDGIKEWFIHDVLKKHFTYGQPYCVMCGKEEKVPTHQ